MYRVMRARVWMAVCRVRGLGRVGRGRGRDAGMATSEYAVGILAAVGIAMAFYKVVTSDAVSAQLAAIVSRALNASV
ncbi:DUF4244 domain-containing protein [Streptomyces roseirectus]|uniref:DUF4244 domain-containing protein n=1 Tax=Streptomyces roseirectus TaxID=2768066 RepID=A0A7H0ISQ8_9ACTN|nr:DUF4244 domain-containing protein [Streptomyces roseirectus]QNP75824.1 DUF4244 domain-containing protein [Streptomyces roseirectus]